MLGKLLLYRLVRGVMQRACTGGAAIDGGSTSDGVWRYGGVLSRRIDTSSGVGTDVHHGEDGSPEIGVDEWWSAINTKRPERIENNGAAAGQWSALSQQEEGEGRCAA